MGLYGWVYDTAPVRARVERLRELGWTWRQIADAADVSLNVPIFLASGRTKRLWPESAKALLSVPLVPPPDNRRGIDSTGSRRRVQALAWMGWPAAEVARRAGTTQATLRTEILPSRRISLAMARRISAVYDELWQTPGPSKRAAAKARSLGHMPPMAWDDDTIDDPAARADRGDERPRTLALAENSDELVAQGFTINQAAERLGVTRHTLDAARARAARRAIA